MSAQPNQPEIKMIEASKSAQGLVFINHVQAVSIEAGFLLEGRSFVPDIAAIPFVGPQEQVALNIDLGQIPTQARLLLTFQAAQQLRGLLNSQFPEPVVTEPVAPAVENIEPAVADGVVVVDEVAPEAEAPKSEDAATVENPTEPIVAVDSTESATAPEATDAQPETVSSDLVVNG